MRPIVVLAGKLHPHGGIETHLYYFCLAVASRGIPVELVVTSKCYLAQNLATLRRGGVRITEYNCGRSLRGALQYVRCLGYAMLRRAGGRLLYSNGRSSFAYLFSKALRPCCWIHHHHTDVSSEIAHSFSQLYWNVLKGCDWLIACTPRQAALLHELLAQKDRVLSLPYLKSEPAGTGQSAKGFKSDRTNKFVIGFFGRLRRSKGIPMLLDLGPWFVENAMECWLHGDDCEGLMQQRLPRGIVWKGQYTSEDLDHLMEGVDVVVLPSFFPEGLPITFSEAVSRGIPVVAFPSGGLRDMASFHPAVKIVRADLGALKEGLVLTKNMINPELRDDLRQKYRAELSNDRTLEWWDAMIFPGAQDD